MKVKTANRAFDIIRTHIHQWKPISWAGYDDDEPDLAPDEPDYDIAKSMLVEELDGPIKSIVRQLPRVHTEHDMGQLLYRTLSPLDKKVSLNECKTQGVAIFALLKRAKIIK